MKKNYFLLLITILVTSFSFGQVTLPHYESFDYTVGADLGAQTNWENYSGGTTNPIDVVAGNLSYSGLKTSVGNSVNLIGGSVDSQILFTEVTSGEVFSSFIIKVTDISSFTDFTDGGYFAIFGEGTTSFNSRLWVHPATNPVGSTFNFAITNASSGTGFGSDHNVNDEIFIVMSYNSTTGVMNAWINPSSSDFEGSAPTATLTATDSNPAVTNRFMLRQDSTGETPGMVIDELRLGSTWASVTPVDATASLNEKSIQGFSTYPNPVRNGKLTINTSNLEEKTVLIYSVLGKRVFEQKFTGNKKEFNISHINSGIYIMKVLEGDKIATKKLVIK